jgi:hypothetical protein
MCLEANIVLRLAGQTRRGCGGGLPASNQEIVRLEPLTQQACMLHDAQMKRVQRLPWTQPRCRLRQQAARDSVLGLDASLHVTRHAEGWTLGRAASRRFKWPASPAFAQLAQRSIASSTSGCMHDEQSH